MTFEFTKNWKFTILNNENVWAKAMNRVINEKIPVDKAVDEMIARIKQVAGSDPNGRAARPDRSDAMSTLVPNDAETAPAGAARRRLSPWQVWGPILIAPYVLVFLFFVIYPSATASGSRDIRRATSSLPKTRSSAGPWSIR